MKTTNNANIGNNKEIIAINANEKQRMNTDKKIRQLSNEYRNKKETIFLSNIPGYLENIKKIDKEENWNIAEKYEQKSD